MVDPNGMQEIPAGPKEITRWSTRDTSPNRRPSHSFQMDNPPAPPEVGARSAGKDDSGHEVIEIENIEIKGTPNLERTPREEAPDDPATVRAVQGTGVIEGSDVVQFLKAMWSGPASWVNAPEFDVDPYNQGADWMGREFGKNLALGGIGKGIGLVFGEARAVLRGLATLGDDVALGVESAVKADTTWLKATTPTTHSLEAAAGAAEASALQVGRFRMTQTVANHATDVVKRGPFKGELARPYLSSSQTVEEIMAAGKGIPDPGGVAGATRWDVPGTFRGSEGVWELVVKDDLILHFNFVSR